MRINNLEINNKYVNFFNLKASWGKIQLNWNTNKIQNILPFTEGKKLFRFHWIIFQVEKQRQRVLWFFR